LYTKDKRIQNLLISGGPLMTFKPRNFHKSFVGPGFSHSGTVYACSGNNLTLGLRRIIGKRVDEELLLGNQRRMEHNELVTNFIDVIVSRTKRIVDDTPTDSIIKYAMAPHAKRKMRMNALKNLDELHAVAKYEKWCIEVLGKSKVYEFAKPGKRPRFIGDFGSEAALVGGYLVEHIKEAMTEPVTIGSFDIVFIKSPKLIILDEVFRTVHQNRRNIIYYHSDDVIGSIILDGVHHTFEMDISSCDCSNQGPIFRSVDKLLRLPGYEHVADAFANYSNLGVKLKDPWKKEKTIHLKQPADGVIEYSGTRLTTVLNNMAIVFICAGIEIIKEEMQGLLSPQDILLVGANLAGYEVTLLVDPPMERLTFLKHNACYGVDGEIWAVQNLGVILRAVGQCDNDFPGSGCVETRGNEFNSSVLLGCQWMGDHVLHDALKDCFFKRTPRVKPRWRNDYVDKTGRYAPRIDTYSLCRRYGVTISQMEELCDYILHSGPGDLIRTRCSDAIFLIDYGL